MPYVLDGQDQMPAAYAGSGGTGLMDYLRRFLAPGNVVDDIDRYRYGPMAQDRPVSPASRPRMSPLAAIADNPAAMPSGRSPEWSGPPRFQMPEQRMEAAPATPAEPDAPQRTMPPASRGGYTRGTNPAIEAISAGSDAATEAVDPESAFGDLELDPSIISLSRGMSQADQNPSMIESLIAQLAGQGKVSDSDKWLAVARGGFGAAASRSPYALGAIGEGANQGLEAFTQSQKRATDSAVNAARLGLTNEQRKETAAHNRATEDYRARDIDERGRDRQERNRIADQQRRDMKDYRDAIAGQGRWSVVGTTKDGKPILMDQRSSGENPVTKVLDIEIGQLGKSGGKGDSVFAQKLAAYKAVGYDEKTATEMAGGQRPTDAATIERVAIAAAKAKSGNEVGQRARQVYDETYAETKRVLMAKTPVPASGGAAADAASPAAAPGKIVAKTQADIDNAPPGSIVVVNGKEYRKP